MHLTSTINPLSKTEENVPIAVFCFGDKRRFLQVSDDYEETINRARNAFGIKNRSVIYLQTSTLDVCKGNDIVIDPSAYPFLWTVIDEVSVVVEDFNHASEPDNDTDQLPTPNSTPVPGPSRMAEPSRDNTSTKEHNIQPEDVEAEKGRHEAPEYEDAEDDDNFVAEEYGQEEVEPPNPEDEEYFLSPTKEVPTEQTPESKSAKKFKAAPADVTSSEIPVIKKEKIQKPESSHSNAEPSKPATVEDSRFEITIYPPASEDGAKFKLRGKHTVAKVLAAACKTFGLDMSRAHLMHSLSLEIDGEVETEDFECPRDETMAFCGIDGNSKLFIKLGDDSD